MSRDVSMMRAGALGAELTESQTALRVFLAAGGLVLLGLVLLLLTIWWWRGTKPEPPALGPLEVMSDRKWATAADGERRRLLEAHRPEGATAAAAYQVPVPVDLSMLARDVPSSFDDLRDPVDVALAAPIDPEAAELASVDPAEALDRPSESPAIDDVSVPDADGADGEVDEGGTVGEVCETVVPVGDVPADVSDDAPEDMSGDAPGDASGDDLDGASDATVATPRPEDSEADASLGDEAPHDGEAPHEAGAPHDGEAPVDATTAMTRDETTAMPAPGQPFAPHAGA